MSISGEIEKLKAQHAAGTLTDAEFAAAKQRVLAGGKPRDRGGLGWALWALIVVVIVAAGAVLVVLDEISRSVQMIAGGVGLLAGAGGAVMAVAEDLSLTAAIGFGLAALAIGAVAFAALSPILIPAALVLLAVAAVWTWFGDMFTG
jgi:hypothetical protein